jgi:hypothetical protein
LFGCIRHQCAIVAGIPSDGHFALGSFPAGTGNSRTQKPSPRTLAPTLEHLGPAPRARKIERKLAGEEGKLTAFGVARLRTTFVVASVGNEGRECVFLETASERAEFPVPAGNDLSAKWPSEGMRATDRWPTS